MEQITHMKRISKRELFGLNGRLDEQDKSILRQMRICHYLTSHQICRLLFVHFISRQTAMRATNRRLSKLHDMGLLYHLDRRIGGVRAGSGANVWALTMAGIRLLVLDERSNEGFTFPRKRNYEPTPKFLEHRLAVAEVYIRLHEFVAKQIHAKATRLELTQVDLEPYCWREYPNIIGSKSAILKPDLYAITTEGEYEDHWFIEVDLATESPSTVIRKCEQYVRYYQNGIEQRTQGVFPRVVWIVPTSKRKDSLSWHIADGFTSSHRELFTVITLDELSGLIQNGNLKTGFKNP
jgi:hypothetical protein